MGLGVFGMLLVTATICLSIPDLVADKEMKGGPDDVSLGTTLTDLVICLVTWYAPAFCMVYVFYVYVYVRLSANLIALLLGCQLGL